MTRAHGLVTRLLPALFLVAAGLGAGDRAAGPPGKPPADSGLVERVTSRLQQIDVTLSGPRESLEGIGTQDFEVTVGGKPLTNFVVDRVCQERPEAVPPEAAAGAAAPAPPPRRSTATYAFYFDHAHMTWRGREYAIEEAKELAPKLVTGGARAMILSNATHLTTYLRLTDDASAVVAALERLRGDVREFDSYATGEDARVAEVLDILNNPFRGGAPEAITSAIAYAKEEHWRQERDLRRLQVVLGRLADLDAPKAVLYFADTMRANPGEHYLSAFGEATINKYRSQGLELQVHTIETTAEAGQFHLDRVIDEADSLGVRFYTVEASGLRSGDLRIPGRSTMSPMTTPPSATDRRFVDAENALAALALETGGRAFLNGVSAGDVAERVLGDLSCIHLVSFDPKGFPRDRPLAVTVRVNRPGVTVQTRGRLVIQGDETLHTSRLLASFAAPEAVRSDVPLHLAIIPTGFQKGSFRARIQVAIPATPIAGATWDLGASLVSRGGVAQDTSGRVTIAEAGVPVVLENEMTFAQGPFELVAVAHEVESDEVASRQIEGAWPRLKGAVAAVSPIAVVQARSAVFVRDEKKRTTGDLALGENDPVRGDRPTAMIGLVCRSSEAVDSVRLDRVLVGETETPLPPTMILFDRGEACTQFRDLVPEYALGEGRYRYVVRVSDETGLIAEAERAFIVTGP